MSQRDGAPASLGIAAWGGRAARVGDAEAVAGSASGGARIRGGARRFPWRAVGLAGVGLAAVLGLARVAGAEAGDSGAGVDAGWKLAGEVGAAAPSATPGAASPDAPKSADVLIAEPPDWWAVLAEIDRRRARALAAVDPDLLGEYALRGSAAWESDAAVIADLVERGLRPTGLTSRVLAVERVERQGMRATMQVVDQRSAYTVVDAAGAVLDEVAPAGPTRWSVTLAQDSGAEPGWRLVDVVPSPPGASASDVPGEEAPGEEVR